MSLLTTFERSGSLLFKYRGQIPVLLFVAVIPVAYLTDYSVFSSKTALFIKILSILVSSIGLLVRIITIGTAAPHTSGRNTGEQVAESLNTTGIYSVVRHPLYLGNYLMWAGITLYVMHLWFFIIVSLLYWLYYERIMFTEECFLEKKFGADFKTWAAKTPAFIPSFKKYVPARYPFSVKRVLSKEYSGLLYMVIAFIYVQTLQDIFIHGKFFISTLALLVLAKTLVIVFTLKVISKLFWQQYRD
ncbi:MAG TPA: isoprenylcysteine carboxylmethyltransferase family protein [Flavisolibacter sp.]|nr:isoprenylcysteine carboxylmethyltransferase family protein [Flavisolibacter sp.]